MREFLRGYEESGVDEIILLLNPRSHEGTMESIELMGKEMLPEFIERDAEARSRRRPSGSSRCWRSWRRRREASTAPGFDENYSFGGLPTGQGGKFTSSEIPEAMAEINEGRVQAAQLEKQTREAAELSERERTVGQFGEPVDYAGRARRRHGLRLGHRGRRWSVS